MNKAEYLLNCSLTYKGSSLRSEKVPENFKDEYEAKKIMLDVLLHEAKESFDTNILRPESLTFCPVDLETSEPGIHKEENEVIRRTAPFPKVHYVLSTAYKKQEKYEDEIVLEDKKPKKYPQTMEQAQENSLNEYSKNLEKNEKRALRELEKEEERTEKKRMLENETLDEKKERLQQQKEKREQKKIEKLEKSENTLEKPKKEKKKTVNIVEDVEPACDQILPPPLKRVSGKVQYYESPIPHDRHMYALERCKLNSSIESVLVKSSVDESSVSIVQGPPGTGKTNYLLHKVKGIKDERILLCSPTNVGASDLYTKCIRMGIKDCSLILPPNRIPKETLLMSEDPKSRIICCTLSGRNGRLLENEEFENVFIDEAGQCMEAHIWGLLRQSVNHVCMVGDIQQLPPQTSETGKSLNHDRSLMHRLMKNNYPFHKLTEQKRMHPEISYFPNKQFYNGELKDIKSTVSVNDPYMLVQVNGKCEEDKTSFYNKIEAQKCIKLAEQLFDEFKNIVIITPYTSQCKFLLSYQSGIPIHTVDSFQGKEADCVILSIVKTDSNIGFWSDPRRLTVALTRAKHKLCVVGNVESWTRSPLKDLYQDGKSRNVIF